METLPDDILLLVGNYLERHDDRYTATFVNRQFHTVFSRVLYRSVSLKRQSQVQSFLKALLLYPHLVPVVRSLAIEDWRDESEKTSLSHGDIAMFSRWASANSHSKEEHQRWEKDLCHGSDEAWIALLLSLVHNLRSLKVLWQRDSRYLETVFVRATTQQKPFDLHPAFYRLEELSLGWLPGGKVDIGKSAFLDSQIKPFLQLPRLKKLSIDSFVECPRVARDERGGDEQTDDNEEQEQHAPKPTINSTITDLDISSSNGAKGVTNLLVPCSSLKSFKYQHTDEFDAAGFQPSAFHRTLSQHKSTLETIWLDNFGTHNAFTATGLNESCDEWCSSFADFTGLKELRIRLPNLFDIPYTLEPTTALTELLPAQIESLFIEGCKENQLTMLTHQLRGVLDARKSRFKALRRVVVEGFFHVDDEDLDASGTDGQAGSTERVIKPAVYETVKPLREACDRAGVGMSVRDRACPGTLRVE